MILKLRSSSPNHSSLTPKIDSGLKTEILANSPGIPAPGLAANSQIAKLRFWWLRSDIRSHLLQVVQADYCLSKPDGPCKCPLQKLALFPRGSINKSAYDLFRELDSRVLFLEFFAKTSEYGLFGLWTLWGYLKDLEPASYGGRDLSQVVGSRIQITWLASMGIATLASLNSLADTGSKRLCNGLSGSPW